jgi:uncharacterized membrane protein
MSKIEKNYLWITVLFYVSAGISHFLFKDFLVSIMPPEIPAKELVVYATGFIEIILGIALIFPKTRAKAAWAIILMLLSYLWVHFYMYFNQEKFISSLSLEQYTDKPDFFFSARIGLQFIMIYWVYALTDEKS